MFRYGIFFKKLDGKI